MTKKVPEWDIFSRVEKLEKLEPTLEDTFILAQFALLQAFAARVQQSNNPRKDLHRVVAKLKELGLSGETLKQVGRQLIAVCLIFEK